MTPKIKKLMHNVSCGIDVDMMSDIEKYMELHNCNRSVAIGDMMESGILQLYKEGYLK